MEIKNLTKNKVKQYAELAKKIISTTEYYTEHAKKEEITKFAQETLEQRIKEQDNLYLYVEQEKELVAFFNGHYDCGTFWVSWLGIEPTHRKKRIGEQIMTYVEQELRTKNIHKIWFDTLVANKEAISLVEKLGFNKVATLINHWYRQDFYIWEKELVADKSI